MRWEDQELNHDVPENKFPEVFFAGLFLLGCASKQRGRFLCIDQQKLDEMVAAREIPQKAEGSRIDRLCLYYRLSCRLGPGGDHYPVLGTTHFWEDSESLYAILYISPHNDWFHIMVVSGESPNNRVERTAAMRFGLDRDGLQTAVIAVASALPAAVAHPGRCAQQESKSLSTKPDPHLEDESMIIGSNSCPAANASARDPRTTRLCSLLIWVLLCLTFPSLAAEGPPRPEIQQAWLSKANRHEKAGWLYLHIEGEPRERGFQHGYLLAKEIVQGIKAMRTDWEYQTATEWSWLLDKSAAMFTRKIDKENLAELVGIVEGMRAAGVPSSRSEIIAYNAYFELSWYWWPLELKKINDGTAKLGRQACSAFIATGSPTSDGGVVLAHNTMGGYYMALPTVIIDIVPAKGHRILMQTYPGWIHSGTDFFITDAGLVGAETTIGDFEGFNPKGIPEFSRMRRATQDANTIEEWCAIMKRGNNGGYANAWLLGDVNSREIARLELGLKYVGFEKKRDGYFVGSNIAEDMKILRFETASHETDIRLSNVARRLRWKQLMSQHAGKIDVEAAERFEADHFDAYLGEEHPGERSLCAHWDLERKLFQQFPTVPNNAWGTLDAKVVDAKMAKRMTFAARWGSACGQAFDAQKFLAEHPQFEWMKDILQSRPSQPWTLFTAGEPQ